VTEQRGRTTRPTSFGSPRERTFTREAPRVLNLRSRAALLAFALVLVASACSSGSSKITAPTTAQRTGTTLSPTGSTAPAITTTKIDHVFIINLENEDFETTWGASSPAKYLNETLRPQGQLLTQYYGIGHNSLDNYIAQISGQAPNPQTEADCPNFVEFAATGTGADGQALGQGCVFPASVHTLGDQLHAAGKTWKAYQEDIANSATEPKTCRHPPIGASDPTISATKTDMYATRHDPWVYFHSVIDSPVCNNEVVGLDALTTDLATRATTPNLSYITPNVCDDGHDAPCADGRRGGLTSADAFLRTWVPKILTSLAFQDSGMLVITFDEAEASGGDADASACCHTPAAPNSAKPGITGPGGGNVGALLISPIIEAGTTNATPYNHYALLCSVENLFGLGHLGFAGAPGLKCFGSDVYK
jgi:phosphatidylinositol-3-phosphatase